MFKKKHGSNSLLTPEITSYIFFFFANMVICNLSISSPLPILYETQLCNSCLSRKKESIKLDDHYSGD
jgi:hypothetical protein